MQPLKGALDTLQEQIRGQVCADDGGILTVAWDAEGNCYYVRCAKNHAVTAIRAQTTAVQENMRSPQITHGDALKSLPTQDIGDNSTLTVGQVAALVSYAKKYGLDAYRGHVYIMYGQPYVGLDGYIYYAHSTKVPYHIGTRPIYEEERKVYQVAPDDYVWIAVGWVGTPDQVFLGVGIVTKAEIEADSTKVPGHKRSPVVAAHPQLQAQKRAEWQWYRRAFPIGDTPDGSGSKADGGGHLSQGATPDERAAAQARAERDAKSLYE